MQFSGAPGDRDFGVGRLNLGMNYAVSERTMLYSNIQTLQALDAVAKDIDAVTAQVGVSFAF